MSSRMAMSLGFVLGIALASAVGVYLHLTTPNPPTAPERPTVAAPEPIEFPSVATGLDVDAEPDQPVDLEESAPTDDSGGDTSLGHRVPLPGGVDLVGPIAAAYAHLETEEHDYAWSPFMEERILDYFARKREFLSEFAQPTVDCRRTMCVLQIVGYGQRAFQDWVDATADYTAEPWFAEFVDPLLQVDRTDTGATAIIAILPRNPATFQ